MNKQYGPYRYDRWELDFLLNSSFLGLKKDLVNQDVDLGTCNTVFDEVLRIAHDHLSANVIEANRIGVRLDKSGKVILPESYQQSFDTIVQSGMLGLGANPRFGGALPYYIGSLAAEVMIGADPSFMIYQGMSSGLVKLIDQFGSEHLKETYCHDLIAGNTTGCLCMTEPQAGSDVGAILTRAAHLEGDKYQISGEKIFISGGMHDLGDNIVYALLARTSDLPGTLGLSCFIVPRFIEDENGELIDNNVRCVRLEDKMGLQSAVTAHMIFGQNGTTKGYLLGTKLYEGLKQIHTVMSYARLGTAIYSLGIASSAYLNAVEYSHQRVQGRRLGTGIDGKKMPNHPIAFHADVQRMTLEMKSKIEGMRMLIAKACLHISILDTIKRDNRDADASELDHTMVEILTPIAKAYCSDQGWRVTELAIQTFGGYGYLKDYPVERSARDIKIMSIWEGTNYHQAIDFVRNKMAFFKKSKRFSLLLSELQNTAGMHTASATIEPELRIFHSALVELESIASTIEDLANKGKHESIAFVATRLVQFIAEIIISWLHLQAGNEAIRLIEHGDQDHRLVGKIHSAKYYLRDVLAPGIKSASLLKESYGLTDHEVSMPQNTPAQPVDGPIS